MTNSTTPDSPKQCPTCGSDLKPPYPCEQCTRNRLKVVVDDIEAKHKAHTSLPTKQASDPLKPSVSLLVKLGSIAVHAEEIMSPGRHRFDISAMQTLMEDLEVREWLKQMSQMAFLPVKR